MTTKITTALLLAALLWPRPAAAETAGVGMALGGRMSRSSYHRVLKVLPGGPADLAGLRTDDRITYVGGVSCRGKSVDEVAGLLRGAAGTEVIVQVNRVFEAISVRMKRQPLPPDMNKDALVVKYPERRLCDYLGGSGDPSDLPMGTFRSDFKCYGGRIPQRSQLCQFKRRYVRPGPAQAQEVKDMLIEFSGTLAGCPEWIYDIMTDKAPAYSDAEFWETKDGKLRLGFGIKADDPYGLALSIGTGDPTMAAPPPPPKVDNTPPADADGWVLPALSAQKLWFRRRSVAPFTFLQSVTVPAGATTKEYLYFRSAADGDHAFHSSFDQKTTMGYLPGHEPPPPLAPAPPSQPDMSPMMSIVSGMQKAKAEADAASKVQAADAVKNAPPDDQADGYVEGPPIVHSRAWFSVDRQGAYTDDRDIPVPPGSTQTRKLYFRQQDEGWKALQAARKPQTVLKFFRGQ